MSEKEKEPSCKSKVSTQIGAEILNWLLLNSDFMFFQMQWKLKLAKAKIF